MNPLFFFKRKAPAAARFLENRVGFAVGDIHGRADLLAAMLALIEARAEEDVRSGGPPIVVFMGDYVDRGPHSAKVIDLLLEQRPRGCERRFLKGNHEQCMLAFLEAPLENRAWLLQGGAETLMAYGVTPPAPVRASAEDWIAAAAALKSATPARHLEFLNGLERAIVLGGYLFVHAGVNPAKSLEQQSDEELSWSRERFLTSRRHFPYRVVHGHTPSDEPYADERRVGVDTGAYASGRLSAARFEGEAVTFLSVSAGR